MAIDRKRPPEIERPPPPEKGVEIERPPLPEMEKAPPPAPPPPPPSEAGAPPPPAASPTKGPVFQRVENILAEGLEDVYTNMPPSRQLAFKEEGEKTASRITELLGAAKIHAKKILALIVQWLKLIPGVNKFFLEQEAKIKTDKIVAMMEEEKTKLF